MSDKRTQNWQPVSNIPLIAQMVDGMLHEAIEHYATLQEAIPKPHVLDDWGASIFGPELFGKGLEH